MRRFKASRAFLLAAVLGAVAADLPAQGAPWNRFRGPNGSGVARATGLPFEFGPDRNVIWKTPLPAGHSSPVLADRHLYVTAFEDGELLTICIDQATGRVVWRRQVKRERVERLDPRNHPASSSVAVDDQGNVYAFFGDYGLISYSGSGRERWKLPLGPFNNVYGMGASPVVAGDKVIMVCDQSLGSFVIAAGRDDGRVRWRTERPEARSGHSTPILYQPAQGDLQVLVAGSFLLTAYSVETGEKVWWVRGLSSEMKSTPVMQGGVLYINGYATPYNQPGRMVQVPEWREVSPLDRNGDRLLSRQEAPDELTRNLFSYLDLDGDGGLNPGEWSFYRASMATTNGMLAIRLGGRGDMTETALLWQYHRAVPQLPSPLLYNGFLYMINDGGIATSLRPESGEVVARGRIKGAVDKYYASPVAADDKIFLVSELGRVTALKTDGSLEVVAVNDLDSPCYATPAIGGNRIYIRTADSLYAFGLK